MLLSIKIVSPLCPWYYKIKVIISSPSESNKSSHGSKISLRPIFSNEFISHCFSVSKFAGGVKTNTFFRNFENAMSSTF